MKKENEKISGKIIATSFEYPTLLKEVKETFEKSEAILKEYRNFGMDCKIRTEADFRSLILNPESYFKSRLVEAMETPQKIFGLNVSKEKAVDLLQLPDFEKIKLLAKDILTHRIRFLTFSDNKVTLTSESLEKLYFEESVTVSSEGQKDFVKAHEDLHSALIEFDKAMFKLVGVGILRSMPLQSALKDYFFFADDGTVSIRQQFYLSSKASFNSL